MKEGWTYKKLGEVCDIYGRIGFRGYTTKDLVDSPEKGAISLSPSNILDGKMDYSKCTYISWFKYEESPEIKIFNGDILLVKTGSSYGKSALVENLPHEATINPQSVVLKNFRINSKFFAYQLRTNTIRKEFDKFVSGTAIPTFSQAKLSTVPIVFPPLDEQQRIVERLDSAFENIDKLKANAEKQLAEAQTLFKKSLAKAMEPKEGWEEFSFGELIKLQSGDYLPSKYMINGKYPVYGGNGIAGYHNQYNRDGGKIVIGRVGALCGNVHYITTPFWLTDNGFEVLLLKNIDIDFKYLSFYLNFLELGKYARQTAQPVISNASLKDVKLFIPSYTVQQRIVERLDSLSENIRKYEEIQRQIISECDALKQALLRKVFE